MACSCSPRAATLSATQDSYSNSGGTVRQTTTSDYQRVNFERSGRHDDPIGRGEEGEGIHKRPDCPNISSTRITCPL
jgi:hypothetical protein